MTERLRLLMDKLKLTASGFADRIGVQRSSVSHVLSGRNKPSLEFLEKILEAFPETDVNWLITGKNSSTNNLNQINYSSEIEKNKIEIEEISGENEKNPPAIITDQPVDQIIIVYKNNTFRILRPE